MTCVGVQPFTAHGIVRDLTSTYPGIATYLDGNAEGLAGNRAAERQVRFLYGRRRCFYGEDPLTEREKRQTKNAVVQMLEADVFKITLLELHRAFQDQNLPVKMVLLLHDGIWFTCPDERVTVTRASEAIRKIMENSVSLSVPLKVELR